MDKETERILTEIAEAAVKAKEEKQLALAAAAQRRTELVAQGQSLGENVITSKLSEIAQFLTARGLEAQVGTRKKPPAGEFHPDEGFSLSLKLHDGPIVTLRFRFSEGHDFFAFSDERAGGAAQSRGSIPFAEVTGERIEQEAVAFVKRCTTPKGR